MKEKFPDVKLVYITSYEEYCLSLIHIWKSVVQYLSVCHGCAGSQALLKRGYGRRYFLSLIHIFVEGTIKLYADDIIYIETELHKNVFYTEKGTFQIYKKLDELENEYKDMGCLLYTSRCV